MKYVFFGTPDFATTVLDKLIGANMPPVAVVCNPDRPFGRKKVITPPPVKRRIMNYELGIREKIKVLQPEKLDRNFLDSLFIIPNSSFDFAIVAAYGKIIPRAIIDAFPKGVIGVHPSLLPKYRGSSPIQSAILDGEEKTGVTLYLLDDKVDNGPILAQREFLISNFQYLKAEQKLAEVGAELLIETLPKYLNGEIKPVPQNSSEATFTKKFTTQDGFVDLEKDDPQIILRKIRALNPEPGVWTIEDGKRTKLLDAELINGALKLKKIQVEGKKPKNL